MRRGTRQLGASPVLIGAVTVMVAIVAVFISYQANNGLPFVPTYQLEAEVPNGAKLVKGNEVRAGGFRVGIVKDIKSARIQVNGKERAIAVLDLKLDKNIEAMAVDSTLSVRPRSALGLKYVELIPGRASATFQDGDTIPIKNAGRTPPSSRTCSPPSRRRRARTPATRSRAWQLDRWPRTRDQHHHRGAPAVHPLPAPGDAQPVRPEDRAARVLSRSRSGHGPGRSGGTGPGALVRRDGHHVRGHRARSRGAAGDHRGEPPTLQAATVPFQVQTPFLARFAAVSRDLQPAARSCHEPCRS